MNQSSHQTDNQSSAITRLALPGFLALFFTFAALSGLAASRLPLFGDEAFYWLESRYLDWSYTDLPGWTAWQAALAQAIGGHSHFGLRWLSWLAGVSLPWLGFWLAWQVNICLPDKHRATTCQPVEQAALAGLLILALPLLQLVGILMLPDIWLLFFSLLLTNLLLAAIRSGQKRWWLAAAIALALAVNVHVRLWIWLFFAAIGLLLARLPWPVWKKLLSWLVPAAIMGLMPILIFNARHDWALFTFQFGRRHPWQFQPENLSLILAQLLLVSPLLFWLWVKSLRPLLNRQPGHSLPVACQRFVFAIGLTAVLHWLFYALTGLFADGLRTTVHWMLASYLPVLALAPLVWCRQTTGRHLLPSALLTGVGMSLAGLLWLVTQPQASGWRSARILDNTSGWQAMAHATQTSLQSMELSDLVADYFMTAAELGFELNRHDIRILPHAKNIKHGRQAQLRLMGLLLEDGQKLAQPALLVVEDSTLKLQDKGRYYTRLCQRPEGVIWLKDVIAAGGTKKFVLLRLDPQSGACQLPAIFYADYQHANEGLAVSGWVVRHHLNSTQPTRRQVHVRYRNSTGHWQQQPVHDQGLSNPGVAQLFPETNDPNLPQVGFAVTLPGDTRAFQLLWSEQMPDGSWQEHRSRHFLVD